MLEIFFILFVGSQNYLQRFWFEKSDFRKKIDARSDRQKHLMQRESFFIFNISICSTYLFYGKNIILNNTLFYWIQISTFVALNYIVRKNTSLRQYFWWNNIFFDYTKYLIKG